MELEARTDSSKHNFYALEFLLLKRETCQNFFHFFPSAYTVDGITMSPSPCVQALSGRYIF